MRTGLKILAKKIQVVFKHPTFLYKKIPQQLFPSRPFSLIAIYARLFSVRAELQEGLTHYNFGSLHSFPTRHATAAYKLLLKFNPGNLGTWSDDAAATHATTKIEFEVIHKLIDLYNLDHTSTSGYVTSGGTESNMFLTWIGRKFLEEKCINKKFCMLHTSLTHYSVRKSADICSVALAQVPLEQKTWAMSLVGLQNTLQEKYKDGFRGFLLPLTLGATAVGTSDPIEQISKLTQLFTQSHPGSNFFIWIDAAYNGLVLPFTDGDNSVFKDNNISAVLVDFHKFGQVPYPAGIVLYKKKFIEKIKKNIDYLEEKDTTLLGSRSGIPAMSIWMTMHAMGKSGYKEVVSKQLNNKNLFCTGLRSISEKSTIITEKNSLTCGVVFNDLLKQRLPEWIEGKYSLYGGLTELQFTQSSRSELIYKFFFLPHIKREIVYSFLVDLKKVYEESK